MDAAEATRALEPLRQMLTADGYDLEVAQAGPAGLHLRVVAGPEACDDCLVPKDVFAGIVRDTVGDGAGDIVLDYPADATH